MATKTDEPEIIDSSPLEQGIADGTLVEVFPTLLAIRLYGKPVVATRDVWETNGDLALAELWGVYRAWYEQVMPALPEAHRLFTTEWDCTTIWVIEDAQAFTILYPQDY